MVAVGWLLGGGGEAGCVRYSPMHQWDFVGQCAAVSVTLSSRGW